MNEKQLEFLNSLEKIDWAKQAEKKKEAEQSSTVKESISAQKLTKSQRKRARRKMKKSPSGPNTAALKNVETIVFENPDATNTIDGVLPKGKRRSEGGRGLNDGIEIDLKKARFEVMKFGMNSMTGSEKYDAETALAVSLGAKPGKKGYVNYKDLQKERKVDREKQAEQETLSVKPKLKAKKSDKKAKQKNPKKNDGITKIKNPKKFIAGKEKGKRK